MGLELSTGQWRPDTFSIDPMTVFSTKRISGGKVRGLTSGRPLLSSRERMKVALFRARAMEVLDCAWTQHEIERKVKHIVLKGWVKDTERKKALVVLSLHYQLLSFKHLIILHSFNCVLFAVPKSSRELLESPFHLLTLLPKVIPHHTSLASIS